MVVLDNIKKKQISGDNLAVKSGKNVVKNIGDIPPYFRKVEDCQHSTVANKG
jgi:hypothetical protein